MDETARLAHYVCPTPNYLESWSDAEPLAGLVALVQPVFKPRGPPRSVLESLAAWMDKAHTAYDLVRTRWEKEIYPRCDHQPQKKTFQAFWDRTLHDGFANVTTPPSKIKPFDVSKVRLVPRSTACRSANRAFRHAGRFGDAQVPRSSP